MRADLKHDSLLVPVLRNFLRVLGPHSRRLSERGCLDRIFIVEFLRGCVVGFAQDFLVNIDTGSVRRQRSP